MLTILKEEQFDKVYKLMEDSFPKDEYRPYPLQRALLANPLYRIYVHEENQELVAFFATWEGPHFIFLEHFAVKERFRNHGLGSKLLQEFLKQQEKPTVIEIEPPVGEMEKRRANFYKRNGFHPTPWGYHMPALAKGQNEVPLVLMSYPNPLKEKEFHIFKDWVFQHVYQSIKK